MQLGIGRNLLFVDRRFIRYIEALVGYSSLAADGIAVVLHLRVFLCSLITTNTGLAGLGDIMAFRI